MTTPELTLKDPLDAIILTAFLSVLSEFPSDHLPKHLIAEINEVGQALENGETEVVADLNDIAAKHKDFYKLYDARCKQLQKQYKDKECNKFLQDTASLEPAYWLKNIAAPILKDPNPPVAAKQREADIASIQQPM